MDTQIKNAIIESTSISCGDNGVLSVSLNLSYGETGQSFIGHGLYLPSSYARHSILSTAGHFISRCLEIAGVEEWDKLKGMAIRVKGGRFIIDAIGHIVKEDWFCPSSDFGWSNK